MLSPLRHARSFIEYRGGLALGAMRGAIRRFPPLVRCNGCGWSGRRLVSDAWHDHAMCPQCHSGVRHRLLLAALQLLPEVRADRILRGKRVLHFAPEAFVAEYMRPIAGSYETADYGAGVATHQHLDMCDMSRIPGGSYDAVIACDVLEHVPSDSRALDEVHRILAPGGWAILTAPQKDGLATTDEDPTITSAQDRTRRFGQEDHLRIYGDDFAEVIGARGFSVTAIRARSFSRGRVRRLVLHPPSPSPHPLATNNRTICFAQR